MYRVQFIIIFCKIKFNRSIVLPGASWLKAPLFLEFFFFSTKDSERSGAKVT